ncbi:MAG: DUF885 domain-containing protein [Alphaproteobacteria bacterium]|nr:DUF885 domain-containing protein [Alphaproteobacteria bacterium]
MTATPLGRLPRRAFLQLSAATAALGLTGCIDDIARADIDTPGTAIADDKLLAFFLKSFTRELQESPEFMTSLGMKTRYGEWSDLSNEFAETSHKNTVADTDYMHTKIDRAALSPAMRVSYDVFLLRNEQRLANYPFRFHNYDVSHFGGPHQNVPTLLINQHRIDDASDAEAYISRIANTEAVMRQTVDFMREAQAKGVTLPRFSYGLMIDDTRKVLRGAPFDGAADNEILADFKTKVGKLSIAADKKAKLIADAESALKQKLKPAFEKFLAVSQEVAAFAKTDHGVGALPNGKAYYDERAAYHTTLKMPAAEIHKLGLAEVARLSADMTKLKAKIGFKGPLKAFYADLRRNPRYLYPTTTQGRNDYLTRAQDLLNAAKAALPSAFGTLPKADIAVKRMEPFLESGQTIAFYNQAAADGSRPGYVFYNLASMATLPKWQMAALAFHEGIPGHHLQISIAQETKNIPDFRKYTFFTAYVEGWALYTEYLAKEMGLYKDDLDEIGRITMELWRACRLVVDTGIHTMGWNRRQAVDYFVANTALTRDNIVREIDRYFVYPGQACAYQIGRNKILDLRERAKTALGSRFDLRAYHDTVLENGALPLPVLETIVSEWVRSRAAPV